MQIIFKRISNTHHILRIVRPDGTGDQVKCETRSSWRHDLVHYAVESEARLTGGFWGLLAGGYSLSDLNDRSGKSIRNDSSEIMTIEAVVGATQGFLASNSYRSGTEFIDTLRSQGDAFPQPDWFTKEFVERVSERVRQLVGRWNAVRFGEEMTLEWPGPSDTVRQGDTGTPANGSER